MNKDLDIPPTLVGVGRRAAEIIRDFVIEHGLEYTGGCRLFRDPMVWDERYGRESLLLVFHEGAASDKALSLDGAYSGGYELYEKLEVRLSDAGVYLEQCTRTYSGVYACDRGLKHEAEQIVHRTAE